MSEHKAKVEWKRTTPDFAYETYDRTHEVTYPGGQSFKASAAAAFAGKAEYANPEEVLAGALSSCHMLTFLAVAAKSRVTVDSYQDEPVAFLDKNAKGKMAVTKITLRPKVVISKDTPIDSEKYKSLHEKAHANCFIANSLACEMLVAPEMT
jgi:organic hydroperoxide reductase OsmC/OhrA